MTLPSISPLLLYALTDALVKVILPPPEERGLTLKVYNVQEVEEEPVMAPANDGLLTVGVWVKEKLQPPDVIGVILMDWTERFEDRLTVACEALKD